MRRKTLLNRNVIIVLMLFIFLLTAFISTAYSLWYFPDSGSSKTINTDIHQDDIQENFNAAKSLESNENVTVTADKTYRLVGGWGYNDDPLSFENENIPFMSKVTF